MKFNKQKLQNKIIEVMVHPYLNEEHNVKDLGTISINEIDNTFDNSVEKISYKDI